MAKEIERLVRWYRDRCNGDWEHQNGVKLVTIDNPGWSLDVNLIETSIAGKTAAAVSVTRSSEDWIFYELKEDLFRGRCGPGNLTEMLAIFLRLAEADET